MQPMESLLTAKISPPRIGTETIWRQRLIENFNGYEHKKLTLVSAPTGYGKTVLISQFASKIKSPVVWYQLDGFDNDITTFIKYFISGISKHIPHFGMQTLDFIERNTDLSSRIHYMVLLIANELEARADGGLVFILEDYHVIDEMLIHKFVEELIGYIPKGVHMVISSRHVLPLNITRLKVHGLVSNVNYENLKFSRDEIDSFLRSRNEYDFSREILEKIELETGGWAVALSLVKSSFGEKKDGIRDIAVTSWKNRQQVYEYFAEEVLGKLPEDMQAFLMSTSVIEVMTPDICDRIAGSEDSGRMLETLMDKNVFLVRLESEEYAYRYHHLFRDFLQEHLGKSKGVLFEKAGQYYLENEDVEQAVGCYISALSYGKAVETLEKTGMEIIKCGKWQTLNRWLEKIPRGLTKDSPWLILQKGIVYGYKGLWDESLIQIERAFEIFTYAGNDKGALNARFQKASALRRAGRLNESLGILDNIIPLLSKSPITDWYDAILEKVNILLWNGRLRDAANMLKQGIEFAQKDEERRLVSYFMEHLGATYYSTGDYHKAIELYKASEEMYVQSCNSISEVEREKYSQRVTQARIYRDWGELDKAFELIKKEIGVKERLGFIDDLPRAYHLMALIHNDFGDWERAREYFEHADGMYRKFARNDFQWTWHMALYGKILIDHGEKEKGIRLMGKALEKANENSELNLAVCEFIRACAYIYLGQIDETLKLLEHSLEVGIKVGAKNLVCQCYWILSNIYFNMGEEETAKAYAKDCFLLASEGNYLQIFLSYGMTSLQIIRLGIEMDVEKEFLEKIVVMLGAKSHEMLYVLMESDIEDVRKRACQLFLKAGGKEVVAEGEKQNSIGHGNGESFPRLRARCFGVFEVFEDEGLKPIMWKTTKAKELLAYLIRKGRDTLASERILEDMWPDMGPYKTSKRLHTYIYQIRSVLKKLGLKSGLIYKDKGYKLKKNVISSDVEEFENLINEASEKGFSGRVKCLEKAVKLYGGDYMEGFYSQWIIDERMDLEKKYLWALELLAKTYMDEKDYSRAAECLNLMLSKDPLLEEGHEMLISAYEKSGNRIAAIQQYEAFCKTLQYELGIEPKPHIKDLYSRFIECVDSTI